MSKLGRTRESKLERRQASISVVVRDERTAVVLRRLAHLTWLKCPNDADLRNVENLFVICLPQDLPDVAHIVRTASQRKKLRALLVRNEDAPHWTTQFLDRAKLRTLRNLLVYWDSAVAFRIVEAWCWGIERKLIADAVALDDRLLVLDCALNRYELPFDKVGDLRRIPAGQRGTFSIDDDGSQIWWPDYDAALNIGSIKNALNPNRALAEKMRHDHCFGRAIARLRRARGLRQCDISCLDERQVRRIETGGSVTLKSLEALADAHEMELNDYLNAVAEAVAAPAKKQSA
jgi:hypothetical protein